MPIIKKMLPAANKLEPKGTEELLRQTQLIVENSHDAIIGETLAGIITSWNGGAERMFGYTAAEVIGKSILFLLPPEMKDEVPTLLNKIKAGEEVGDYDSVRLRKNGSKISIALSISPIKLEDGTVIGASVVERDITLRKEAERHIKELNQVRNKFIEIISHQLRTPITAVNWNLESILNGDFGKLEETQRQFLQATYSSSLETTRRIGVLLTAMDIEEERITYEKGEVVLNSLCAGIISEVQKKCSAKDISCVYTPAADNLPAISGDGQKIRMVIASLVENAITYTKEKGEVTVLLKLKDNLIRCEVADTGVGIPQAEQHLIFSRFFRASNAVTMQPDAFGLELFIAKNFIEKHQGKIGFTSQEGKGSMFWFEIPLKNETTTPAPVVPVVPKVTG